MRRVSPSPVPPIRQAEPRCRRDPGEIARGGLVAVIVAGIIGVAWWPMVARWLGW